ncbi:hypothetical protein Q73A0000_03900 [Kaistella flava (ex Peng et al. 2021)]|uniref:Uncharacterized protein n=1 Tax=Kaistella flava (ex Peng et al. 2021) TaxID=2038776 RepID=A0A7M2Y5P9_9FLAO|nr:hypothetical protein [Kaistella flava (ex Peng et al. 2021)]QOW09567.1 hypothetical protein Q73A0000_03900 [Kaistella flava (ex Peng et al. 2021)]
MDDFDKIIKKLDEVYLYSGIAGLVFFLLLAIILTGFWIYFKSSIEKSAQYEFDAQLTKLQGEIQKTLNEKSNEQQALYSEKLALYQLDLNKELSKISSDLDFEKNQKIEIKNEERKSIIEFLGLYSDLVYGALDIKILDYGYNNYEEIKTRLKEIDRKYSALNVIQNNLKFWSDNHELVMESHKLQMVILDYSHFTQRLLGKLEFNLKWGKSLKDTFVENFTKSSDVTDFLKELAEEEKKIRMKNDELYTEYWKERKPYFDNFLNANNDFIKLAKTYIS